MLQKYCSFRKFRIFAKQLVPPALAGRCLCNSAPLLDLVGEHLPDPPEPVNSEEKERAITQHMLLLELSGQQVRPSIYQHLSDVSFVLAENAGLTTEQKQELLEMASENERLNFLTGHFESILPHVQELEQIKRKIKSNGHFEEES